MFKHFNFKLKELCFLVYIILQSELGANAILAVSIAACKAGAAAKEARTSVNKNP